MNDILQAALELKRIRPHSHFLIDGGLDSKWRKIPIVVDGDKIYPLRDWQNNPVDIEEDADVVEYALEQGHMLGLGITAKSRLLCLDFDFDNEDSLHEAKKFAVDKFGPMLLFHPSLTSPDTKGHGWYEVTDECAERYLNPSWSKLAPRKWYMNGDSCGEVRFVKGQMAFHGDELIQLVKALKSPLQKPLFCIASGPWHKNEEKKKSFERATSNTTARTGSGITKYSQARLEDMASQNWRDLKDGKYGNLERCENTGKVKGSRHDAFYSCCIRNYQLTHAFCPEELMIKNMVRSILSIKPDEPNPERTAKDAIAAAKKDPGELHYPVKLEPKLDENADEDSCDTLGGMIEIDNIGPISSNYHKYVRMCLEAIDLIPKLNLLTSEWSIEDSSKKYLKSGEWISTSRDAIHRLFQETFFVTKKNKEGSYSAGLGLSSQQIMSGIISMS